LLQFRLAFLVSFCLSRDLLFANPLIDHNAARQSMSPEFAIRAADAFGFTSSCRRDIINFGCSTVSALVGAVAGMRTVGGSLDLLYLNQIAQGVGPLNQALDAYRVLSPSERSGIIHLLSMMIDQAHPCASEITDAIRASGLKPSFTPCVMLVSGSSRYSQLSMLADLPDDELDKVFVLLMHLFQIADSRRRASCGDTCYHWWHQNLSDETVVRELQSSLSLKSFGSTTPLTLNRSIRISSNCRRFNRRHFIAALAILTVFAAIGFFFFLLPHGPSAVDVTTQSIVVGDVERSFRVVVPHKLRTPAPVVFAFQHRSCTHLSDNGPLQG